MDRVNIDFLVRSPAMFVLAESVTARDNVPPFRASIMDGYALSGGKIG